jgi:hypothetical protein
MILVSAWAGGKSQPEPWDKNLKTKAEKDRSTEFWSGHALIWGCSEINGSRPITEVPRLG